MQKKSIVVAYIISLFMAISCSDEPGADQPAATITTTNQGTIADSTSKDYSKFSYSFPESDYVFQIEITSIETQVKKAVFESQGDQYSPKEKVDGYLLKIKYKMTNPYDKSIMAPVPDYYYIGTLDRSFFSSSTTFQKACQCNIDNSAEITDSKGRNVHSFSDGKCGFNDPCVKFQPNETKEFIISFTDPIYKDAKQLIFSGFHKPEQHENYTKPKDIVLLLDTEKKKVVGEIQF